MIAAASAGPVARSNFDVLENHVLGRASFEGCSAVIIDSSFLRYCLYIVPGTQEYRPEIESAVWAMNEPQEPEIVTAMHVM